MRLNYEALEYKWKSLRVRRESKEDKITVGYTLTSVNQDFGISVNT